GVFFFFQAEDGIRDWSVTGVQTCALPIFANARFGRRVDGSVRREPRDRVAGRPEARVRDRRRDHAGPAWPRPRRPRPRHPLVTRGMAGPRRPKLGRCGPVGGAPAARIAHTRPRAAATTKGTAVTGSGGRNALAAWGRP